MIRYLLDTNVVSDFLKHQPEVVAHFQRSSPALLAVSSITVMEIEYGFERQPAARARLGALWTALLRDIRTLPFEVQDAAQTAQIRAHRAQQATPIGPFDLQLAGTAVARQLRLVTHNTSEFERVPGLLLEDWRQA